MQLAQGERLGHYRVEEPVGAGGMGEVYRAHDTRLGRDVAIKLLPEELAADADRLARLEREARLLASVNHPNVATLHGIERSGDDAAAPDRARTFLVMELVRGEDLAHRLTAGPLPVAEALEIAAQIADGLRAAHDQGVIHRDLKPANIRITPEGTVKILDFGLARPWEESRVDEDLSDAPTRSLEMTTPGALLGTAPYMSPEQASGRAADRRTDIWAFGCVLYEMLTARPAFRGDSSTEVLARILEAEPDWDALPPEVPSEIRRLLGRCLEKRVHRRLRDAGDLALTLQGLVGARLEDADASSPERGRRGTRLLPWLIAAAAVVVAALAWLAASPAAPPPAKRPIVRFVETPAVSLDLASLGHSGPAVAVAPDGRSFVFVGAVDGTTALYLRRLVHDRPERIDGTDGARAPFFSPDGEWVGFWAAGRLWKVAVDGGHPQTIAEISHVHGVSWGEDAIVFAGAGDGSLWWVDPGRGEVRTIAERTGRDVWGEYPYLLPGGDAMLVTSRGEGGIDLVSLDTGDVTEIVDEGTDGRYLSSGHLVWAHHGDLLAAPFDLVSRRLTGDARTVTEGVLTESSTWTVAQYAVSDDGTLVFLPGGFEIAGQLPTWVTLDGTTRPLNLPVDRYLTPRISPDGRRILLGRHAGTQSLWVAEPEREVMTPVTDDGGEDFWAVWSLNGRDVVFNSIRPEGPANLWSQPVDRGRPPRRLSTAPAHQPPGDLTPDGRSAVVAFATSVTKDSDIHLLPLDGDGSSRPLLATDADEIHPKLSPDGRWLAYASDVTGRPEVYVQPFPDLGAVVRASPDGGQEPLWSPAGDRLYFRSPSGREVFAVDVLADEPLQLGRAQLLFEGDYQPGLRWGRLWDLHPDGDRFLLLEVESLQSPTSIQVVVNWSAELEGQVPPGG